MKAAANKQQCLSSLDGAARAGLPGRVPGLHQPRRRFVGMGAAPRLTAALSGSAGIQAAPLCAPLAPQSQRASDASLRGGAPRVLLVDGDSDTALALTALLMPEAHVVHVATLSEARRLLGTELYALVVLDPSLPDGDGRALLPSLATTPLLVYAGSPPHWPGQQGVYLAKPWTPPRLLFSTISRLLGITPFLTAGD